jgi:hypothetical protein
MKTKKQSIMKIRNVIKMVLVVLALMLAPGKQAQAATVIPATTPEERAMQLEKRLNEIKAIDPKTLSRGEKRALRGEVKAIKKEMKTISGGVYLSVGALILIVLLLILLL